MIISIATSKRMDIRANSRFLSLFSLATLEKALSSCASLTKALMTRIPVKVSCVKSYRRSNCFCLSSHLSDMIFSTRLPQMISASIGSTAIPVMIGSRRNIFQIDTAERNTASTDMMVPHPTNSSTASTSEENQDMIVPILFSW